MLRLAGVDETQARFSPVPTGTSLRWLVVHLTLAEEIWIVQRFAGESSQSLNVNDNELPIATVVGRYENQWVRTAAYVESASLDDLTRDTGSESPVNLRWVLSHLLEETARHAGHADILRELIDGTIGR